MNIEIELSDSKAEDYGQSFVKIPFDADDIEGSHAAVADYVSDALEGMFGGSFTEDDFTVLNMDAVLEEIAFSEFEDKTM